MKNKKNSIYPLWAIAPAFIVYTVFAVAPIVISYICIMYYNTENSYRVSAGTGAG